jgi:hypothetical protein
VTRWVTLRPRLSLPQPHIIIGKGPGAWSAREPAGTAPSIMNGTTSRGANARAGGGSSMSSAHMLTGPETRSGVTWKIRAAISSILSRESIKRSIKSLVARCVCPERLCKADREIAHGMRLPSVLIVNVRRSHPTAAEKKASYPIGTSYHAKGPRWSLLKQQI